MLPRLLKRERGSYSIRQICDCRSLLAIWQTEWMQFYILLKKYAGYNITKKVNTQPRQEIKDNTNVP